VALIWQRITKAFELVFGLNAGAVTEKPVAASKIIEAFESV